MCVQWFSTEVGLVGRTQSRTTTQQQLTRKTKSRHIVEDHVITALPVPFVVCALDLEEICCLINKPDILYFCPCPPHTQTSEREEGGYLIFAFAH